MRDDARTLTIGSPAQLGSLRTRRGFLQMLGMGGAIVFLPSVLAACGKDSTPPTGAGGAVRLDLRTDIGIFNYALALEQLEAAFYTQVVERFSSNGISDASERTLFTDLRNHEVIHRDFIRAALGSSAIPDLQVDFGTATNSRTSVIDSAIAFEDLGVSAYNGAGKYLANPNNLLLAGKIVSVEARHASAVRDLRDSGDGRNFASNADAQGLDVVREPGAVLQAADPFVTTPISISHQPTA